jgi:fluoroacetyl-CoA thioesterase
MHVDERMTVPQVSPVFKGFSDMPPVFATAFLVGFMEWVCVEMLRPYLGADEQSVGVHIDLSHVAATPVGMNVTAQVELVEIDGCRLRFKIVCRDEVDIVSEGWHERFVVERVRFDRGLTNKLARAATM